MSSDMFLANLSPAYGALTGKGMFGDVLGKKSEMKAEEAAKIASDKAAADEKQRQDNEVKNMAVLKSQGMKKGGKVSSASSRGDGIAQRGKTRGRMI